MARLRAELAAAALLALGLVHAGEPKVVLLDVPTMSCSLCPVSVRKALERTPGVLDAKADLATKQAEVRYDPDSVSPQQLADAVTNAGFPATVK
ncbi:MAG: hypothetical protein A3D95_08780 [Betaproteobacteria bacterium RIFCSPHIGHO2_12_FULL_69_13]|nr:MAG: hypothetical protein A3D95_08780 [Betaproteobacteria bacterium RIFCSPHIGHO2_12_FULL_69_13]OGA65890.1 MAG: hypothetical protein A3G83_01930 [Betaproteobacteria bacterium RIFCSPLOWO2_12_FULL_68_20]